MDLFVIVLGILSVPLAFVLLLASREKGRRARLEAWPASLSGLRMAASSADYAMWRFPAEHDGLQVSLVLRRQDEGADSTCLTVAMPDDGYVPAPAGAFTTISPTLSVRRRYFFGRGLECGDEVFNKALIVTGDEVRCAAVMDQTTRLTLQGRLSRLDLVVEASAVSCTMSGILTEAEVRSIGDGLLEVARLLRMSAASFPERLLSTARSDPVPRVRTRAIAALIVGFGERPETADAIQTVGHGGVQELFLDHLEESARSQGVVFHALSKIGTLASVERLLKLKGDSDTDYFRNVCVEAIQKRLGAGEQGWLSIAAPGDHQGALSTADEGSTLAIAKSETD